MRPTEPRTLDEFLTAGTQVTEAIMAEDGGVLLPALREFHDFFAKELWGAESSIGPTAALLGVQGHFYWLGAVRLALSGQLTGVFPLLRTGLEAYCYGARINADPELEEVWRKRDTSKEAAKQCRRVFTSAVSDVAKAMEKDDAQSGEWILEHYDMAIEWGGHPNPRILYPQLVLEEREEGVVLSSTALHGPGSNATNGAIVACLDIGLAMAAVAAWTRDVQEELSDRLNELVALQERVVGALTPDN